MKLSSIKIPKVKIDISQLPKIIDKNAPTILTALAVGGVAVTVYLSIKATPNAMKKVEVARHRAKDPLTTTEIIKAGYKPYIPAALTGCATIACIVGSNTISHKRQVALTSAYILSEKALEEYKNKVVEIGGEEADNQVKKTIVEKAAVETPPEQEFIVIEGDRSIFYDYWAGKWFWSKKSDLVSAETRFNEEMATNIGCWYSVNDWLDFIGLTTLEAGEYAGWDVGTNLMYLEFVDDIPGPNGEGTATGVYYTPKPKESALYL